MSTTPVEVTRVPLTSIVPNAKNYKYHSPAQIADLKASLTSFGQMEAAVVKRMSEERYLLVAHEGVWTAAMELYQEDPLAHKDLYSYLVIIVPEEWTDEQVRGYMVASNETMRLGSTDDKKLLSLLEEQRERGYGLARLGLSDDAYLSLAELADFSLNTLQKSPVPPPPSRRKERAALREITQTPRQLPLEESAQEPTKPASITPISFRQLVLVMSAEAYETMQRRLSRVRERQGLGSHADVVEFLLDYYLEQHPELAG